jgi:hypothetical protein
VYRFCTEEDSYSWGKKDDVVVVIVVVVVVVLVGLTLI